MALKPQVSGNAINGLGEAERRRPRSVFHGTGGEVLNHLGRHELHHYIAGSISGDPNIVEVYVRHLRRKIDEPFGIASIQTVRGSGYRLTSA